MLGYFKDIYLNQSEGYAKILAELVYVIVAVLIFSKFKLEWRYALRKLLEMLVFWLLIQAAAGIAYPYLLVNVLSGVVLLAIYPAVLILYAFYCRDYPPSIRLMLVFLFYSCFLFAAGISGQLDIVIEENTGTTTHFGVWIHVAMIVGMYIIVTRMSMTRIPYLPAYGIGLTVTTDTLFIGVYELFHNAIPNERLILTIMDFCFYILAILTYCMCFFMAKDYSGRIEAQVREDRLEKENTLLAVAEKNQENLHKMRHDIKNQMAYMQILLEKKDYDQLLSYFKTYTSEFRSVLSYKGCGNETIDNVLLIELANAERCGVSLESSLILPPKLPFQENDLVSLLCNLIDNAINACKSLPKESRVVSVDLKCRKNYFFVRVINPLPKGTDKQTLLNRISHTAGDGLHGYGVAIVKEITKKYNGAINFDVQNGTLISDGMLMLPLLPQEEK